MVGDLAQIMVSNGLTGEDVVKQAGSLNFPNSVIQFLQVTKCNDNQPVFNFYRTHKHTPCENTPIVSMCLVR